MGVITVKLKTIITDEEGNEIDLENIDQYIRQTLTLKIVQVSTGRVLKEREVKLINKRRDRKWNLI